MKILYIECSMGVAGDMLMGALYELLNDEDRKKFTDKMNSLGIEGLHVEAVPSVKCGINGTHMNVTIDGHEELESHHAEHHHHHGASMHDIRHVIDAAGISENVKKNAVEVYECIAQAESRVHGKSADEIHFHEVGSKDAMADVIGCCMLIDIIGADRIVVSPVTTGFGNVRCAHGILPVPAPATALILNDVPLRAGSIEGELCTPTGAALVKHYADEFGNMPQMTVSRIGYGMGTKDFAAANCVRVFVGIQATRTAKTIVQLCCNIDDMTAEELGYAAELLMDEGALDVYTTAIGMKKSRPGTLLTVMCREEDRERIAGLIFRNTTTLGMRVYHCERMILERSEKTLHTEFGDVRCKEASGYGVVRSKLEYDDVRRLAKSSGRSIREIRDIIENMED
ncbi:nickel pincer cofactor biosynthesis protein LarC [[Bacteroides] pectinophilus]|jgi:TIGR00299 family protein|uniref:Pyridinium-3,5-bisthiocarboxylic acid mononucleotide nickel insertion protein n=1 Tax=[Bacteroides] pectinophilus ATCC 43243 TaxID=483218 RepID=B7ATF1_9FIRM|nr:TIGR00299 family protein [[Bacteroides] pectinophilus ATCC 43243]UWN94706.1 nickel pincer cofactor biosynthesis protein LarC [[Bacteroides] pectinophilus]